MDLSRDHGEEEANEGNRDQQGPQSGAKHAGSCGFDSIWDFLAEAEWVSGSQLTNHWPRIVGSLR